jgi:hypothetical protein
MGDNFFSFSNICFRSKVSDHATCSYLQLHVVVLAYPQGSMVCEYASTTTCEYRFLQVSCHRLLALHLRQLHVALRIVHTHTGTHTRACASNAQEPFLET